MNVCCKSPSSQVEVARRCNQTNAMAQQDERQQQHPAGEKENLTWHKYLHQQFLMPYHHLESSQSYCCTLYGIPTSSLINNNYNNNYSSNLLELWLDISEKSDIENLERKQNIDDKLLNPKAPEKNLIKKYFVDNEQQSNSYEKVNLSTVRGQLYYHSLILLLVVITSLTCIHNAQTCTGFSLSEHGNNPGLTGATYPLQPYRPSHLTSSQWNSRWPRSYNDNNDDLTGTMSSTSGSFSQDPSSTIGPPGASHDWTSILNPFGLGLRPQPASTGNNGGGGDELDNHIKKILVPRVSGTPGNIEVREYIVNELKRNNFHIELDEFTGNTPVGKVKFANIIASTNPKACRQLVLACHYDSKLMDGFLGAIDSAVPCSMLLIMAKKFNKSFRSTSDSSEANNLGLQMIFFDGEEAFVQWTHTDSLYGSRHLAAKWEKQRAPEECGQGKSQLDRIEMFVLLDLIGASDTSFVMYNTQLRKHYEDMQKYEKAFLVKSGLSQIQTRRAAAFKSRTMPLDFVEDDHVPFRKRGVPILLLLAHPFPRVWHTVADNYEAIDFPKTRRILHVLEEFVANYPNGSDT